MLILKQYYPNEARRISIVDTLYDAVRVLESEEALLFNVEDEEVRRRPASSILQLLKEMEEAGDYIDLYKLIDEVLAKQQRCEED